MVRWKLTDCEQRQETIIGYHLGLTVDGVEASMLIPEKDTMKYLLDFLTPNSAYEVKVAIVFKDRVGQYSEVVKFRTPPGTYKVCFETI